MSFYKFGPDKNKGVRENCKHNRMDKQIDRQTDKQTNRHNNKDRQTIHHYNTIAQLKPQNKLKASR